MSVQSFFDTERKALPTQVTDEMVEATADLFVSEELPFEVRRAEYFARSGGRCALIRAGIALAARMRPVEDPTHPDRCWTCGRMASDPQRCLDAWHNDKPVRNDLRDAVALIAERLASVAYETATLSGTQRQELRDIATRLRGTIDPEAK